MGWIQTSSHTAQLRPTLKFHPTLGFGHRHEPQGAPSKGQFPTLSNFLIFKIKRQSKMMKKKELREKEEKNVTTWSTKMTKISH
jgi:hypothetical protein